MEAELEDEVRADRTDEVTGMRDWKGGMDRASGVVEIDPSENLTTLAVLRLRSAS